ncbi:MAG: hypothetical protein H7123_02110 [Thermoleophilia bacterium]|nr:hypothetical protein [Thermoleophilia bacterium]
MPFIFAPLSKPHPPLWVRRATTPPPPAGALNVQAVHMTQYRSLLVPDGLPLGNANCGPTSAIMGLRLLGLDLPGFHGERSEQVIDAARMIATGSADATLGTTKTQQALVMKAGGASIHGTMSLDEALAAVRGGSVALVGGDFNAAQWKAMPDRPAVDESSPAAHAIVVSNYDRARKQYWVNDPLLTTPRIVTRSQLDSFTGTTGGRALTSPAVIANRPARLPLPAQPGS